MQAHPAGYGFFKSDNQRFKAIYPDINTFNPSSSFIELFIKVMIF